METEEWGRAENLVYEKLSPALSGPQLSTAEEIERDLIDTKSTGFFGRFGGYMLVKDFKLKAKHETGDVLSFSRRHHASCAYPFVYYAKMKEEMVPIEKIMRRKQRMFTIMCKEHVVIHKYFFARQNKRLHKYQEIAHGQTWFYGFVNRFAEELERHDVVVSEDDEFWDKSYYFAKSVYSIQTRVLRASRELKPEDYALLRDCVSNCIKCIVVLPTGDVVSMEEVNPSGKDGTTESNCVARCLVEAYMQILYFNHIGKPVNTLSIVNHKLGTKYLGDDRIAGSSDYESGYLDFYEQNVKNIGVRLKTYVRTKGAEGAEFAGFTFARAHWNSSYFVPQYKLDKLWFALFVEQHSEPDIILSRFMAFAFLIYPHYSYFKMLRPIIVDYLKICPGSDQLRAVAIHFWWDEDYIRRAWTGLEGMAGGGILERCPQLTPLHRVLHAKREL